MKASYELTADDLAAFTLCHSSTSPVVRRQRAGCLVGAVLLLLSLPTLLLTTSDKPIAETAKNIWPLLAGPALFILFIIPYLKWRTANLSQRLLREGTNAGFYGQCTLSLDDNGLTETKESGDTSRKWAAVEKIVATQDHLFVYTSGIEAFVIPTRAFQTSEDCLQFQKGISERSGVSVQAH
tara:strand:+ start:73 stop:618 length:546 start_codon:yes stop_codon:yes gene_type:complete